MAAAFALLSACGGGDDFGENVRVPQSKHQSVAAPLESGATLTLPGDKPFNLTDAQRNSRGPGAASSSADPAGSASCAADAFRGGSADAAFQIGHVLNYGAPSPFAARVTFHVTYECSLTHAYAGAGKLELGLKAYVMDSDHRVIGRVLLASADIDRMPSRWTGSESPSFDVTLQPGTAYHLVVAAQVKAETTEEPGPTATVYVKSLAIDVTPAS